MLLKEYKLKLVNSKLDIATKENPTNARDLIEYADSYY